MKKLQSEWGRGRLSVSVRIWVWIKSLHHLNKTNGTWNPVSFPLDYFILFRIFSLFLSPLRLLTNGHFIWVSVLTSAYFFVLLLVLFLFSSSFLAMPSTYTHFNLKWHEMRCYFCVTDAKQSGTKLIWGDLAMCRFLSLSRSRWKIEIREWHTQSHFPISEIDRYAAISGESKRNKKSGKKMKEVRSNFRTVTMAHTHREIHLYLVVWMSEQCLFCSTPLDTNSWVCASAFLRCFCSFYYSYYFFALLLVLVLINVIVSNALIFMIIRWYR